MEAIKNLIKQIVILFLPAEQREVISVLESYAAAFLTFKPSNVIGYFDQPLSLLLDTGPEVFDSEAKVTKYLEGYMKELQDKHYATDVLTKMRLKSVTTTCVGNGSALPACANVVSNCGTTQISSSATDATATPIRITG